MTQTFVPKTQDDTKSSSTPPSSSPHASKPRLELIASLEAKRDNIKKICKISGVPGLSITIIDHGETIFQHYLGYGDLVAKEPVTPDTIFHMLH
jgi:CubicO group peptidase (beta-lactamase class C family)